jgi:hypothetical protein
MALETAQPKPPFRERFLQEMKRYLVVVAYLAIFFGSFITYRRLVLAEYRIDYLEYGWAIIKALVLGKVILIGEIFHLGERFKERPLIVSTMWKTLVFAVFIAGFAVIERGVAAQIHHRPIWEEFQFSGRQGYEMLARVELQALALIPLFAFQELARVLGQGKLESLFLRGPGASPAV